MGASDKLTGVINFVTAVLSVVLIGAGIWLARKHSSECIKFLQWPVIVIGVFILLVSLAGFVGACWGVPVLLWLYLLAMFVLILLLLVFTVFAFVVTNPGAGHAVAGRGYKEHRLQDYSTWLQNRVNDNSNWRKIKSCLQDANVCGGFSAKYNTLNDFVTAKLSAVQGGCCEPPAECNFAYAGGNTWTGVPASTNPDCTTWTNNQSELCFNCNSCKAGVLDSVRHDWRIVAGVNLAVLVILIVVYSIGCCAFRNVRKHRHAHRYGKHGGYA